MQQAYLTFKANQTDFTINWSTIKNSITPQAHVFSDPWDSLWMKEAFLQVYIFCKFSIMNDNRLIPHSSKITIHSINNLAFTSLN